MATSSILSLWMNRNYSKVNRLTRFTKLYTSTGNVKAKLATSATGHSPVAWSWTRQSQSGTHVHRRQDLFQRHNFELSVFRNKGSTLPVCASYQVFNQFSSSSGGKSGIGEADLKKEIDSLTDQFMETRDLLEDAMESKGSVYFNDDLVEAKQAVQETLRQYQDLLKRLDEEQERNVRRTIGLKMEELRAQENMILESLKDD